MRKNRTYIIRWDREPSLFRLEGFERRFGKGISDERSRLMPYFSLHVHDMSELEEGDSFYLLDGNGLIMKGMILSRPYHGYKGDEEELFADIYPEFAAHPSSDKLLSLTELSSSLQWIYDKEGLLSKKEADALDEVFIEYRNRVIPLSSDFAAAPLSISSHVRFPALSSKSHSIIEEVDYRRYLQSRPRITEGYQKYRSGSIWHYRINIDNFRLLKSYFSVLREIYGKSPLTITFGLSGEDYCENDGLSADEAEHYLEGIRREIEENTLFSILTMAAGGNAAECAYITPEKELLLSTEDCDAAERALSSLGLEEKEGLLFMSQFITEESQSMQKAYRLVDDAADALPGTMYFSDDDDEEEE